MKIPPNNIDTWMHRTYNNSVLVKAEHGDYTVSLTPEGYYLAYHNITRILGYEEDCRGITEIVRATAICRIHAIAMLGIKNNLASYEIFTSEMLELIERDAI